MNPGEDYISLLPEDLLLRILRLVPTKEAAGTTVLSRRWKPLWTSSGAVNLEVRIPEDDDQRVFEEDAFFARRDRFVADAHKALDAFTGVTVTVPVTRLTFLVEGQSGGIVRDFLNHEADRLGRPEVLARVLAHPAVKFVEELMVSAVDNIARQPMLFQRYEYEADWISFGTRMYYIDMASLPSGTLRVLDLTNCGGLTPSLPPPAFPHLWKLRLCHCGMLLEGLQAFINSAPQLETIHLEYVLLEDTRFPNQLIVGHDAPPSPGQNRVHRSLHCPTAKKIQIHRCCLMEEGTLELYAPRLVHFEYNGVLRHIIFSPMPKELVSGNITVIQYRQRLDRDPAAARSSFWGFLGGLCSAKHLNLSMRAILKGITVAREPSQASLLPLLGSLQKLELNLVFSETDKKAPMLIANFLRCCPMLEVLQLNLTTCKENSIVETEYAHMFLQRKAEADLEKSMRILEISETLAAREEHQEPVHRAKRPRVQPDAGELPLLRGLSNSNFHCLQSSLKSVSLQFRQGEKNSFGIQLIKFFVINAKVLDNIFVDAGNLKLCEHEDLEIKIKKWIADWSERTINVLPLDRRT